jgi:hypothetical protein
MVVILQPIVGSVHRCNLEGLTLMFQYGMVRKCPGKWGGNPGLRRKILPAVDFKLCLRYTRGKDRCIWEPYVLNAYGSHMCGSWNKCVNHVCCTFVFGGDTKAKTKMQQRSLTPLFYNLCMCKPYVFNAYGFHMCRSLPPVLCVVCHWMVGL